jgi:hypothetical protein
MITRNTTISRISQTSLRSRSLLDKGRKSILVVTNPRSFDGVLAVIYCRAMKAGTSIARRDNNHAVCALAADRVISFATFDALVNDRAAFTIGG